MKKNYILLFSIIVTLTINLQIYGQNGVAVDNHGSAISEKDQKILLSTRLKGSPITGNFGSFGSFLFALFDLAIHTDHKEIGNIKLESPFPSSYKPTWKEVFDTVAIQTQTTWSYDAKRNYWLFTPTQNSTPFNINIADGWTSKNQGIYIGYKPPTYPIGMDIYQMGTYSADNPKDETKLFEEIRNDIALRFAINFNKEIKTKDMKSVKVDGADSLFYETVSPFRKELIWRQWAFVKNGRAFVIVSALQNEETKLYEDVQAMVKSFQVK